MSNMLRRMLGSFWNETYGGREEVAVLMRGVASVWKQLQRNLQEAAACLSRDTVPVHHVRQLARLELLRSRCERCNMAELLYGDTATLAEFADPYTFGQNLATQLFVYPAHGLAAVTTITDRITAPTRVYAAGIDFILDRDNDRLIFRRDPFADAALPRTISIEAGRAAEETITLWLRNAHYERHYIRDHHGFVLGFNAPSSQQYRAAVNAVMDGVVQGTSQHTLLRAFASVLDIPLTRHAGEVVEHVTYTANHLLVITDQEAYRFPATAVPAVTVGQVLREATPLVAGFQLWNLRDGTVPAALTRLTIEPELLSPGYYAGVTFENRDVPLVVETVEDRTKVSCELGGFALDVERFWDDMHARGLAADFTLAQALDIRPDPTTEPTAANLPATINPLKFITANFLRYNAFVVHLDVASVGPDCVGLAHLRQLRRLIPPHTCMLLVVSLPAQIDSVMMGIDEADADQLPDPLPCAEILSDGVITEDDPPITVRAVAGVCH